MADLTEQQAERVAAAEAVDGWMRTSELRWLAQQADGKDLVIEFGAWVGKATTVLLGAKKVVSCDSWSTELGLKWDDHHVKPGLPFNRFFETHRQPIVDGVLIPYVMDLAHKDFRDTLARDYGGKGDLVFIDADHTRQGVTRDIETALRVLRPGGVLAGHDYGEKDWPGVAKAVEAAFPGFEDIARSATHNRGRGPQLAATIAGHRYTAVLPGGSIWALVPIE